MDKLSFAFVTALALAAFGCKKTGGDCAKAIAHSSELAKADMQKSPGMDDKMLQKLRDVGVQHCTDDHWSDDAVKCMIDAKTETEAQACYGKLSKDQQDTMNRAAMDAMKSAAPAAPAGSAEPPK